MLLVPPGTFQMGCIMGSSQFDCLVDDLPVHQVTLTSAFYMGRYEVTQAQWTMKMGSNPSYFQSSSEQVPAAQVPNRPVETVSWTTIQSYLSVTGMRLPTEAEWEYACRAGTQTPFYNGSTDDNTLSGLSWFYLNSNEQTRPVGGKLPNGLGFYDMLGNVFEWVSDRFGPYPSSAQVDPAGAADSAVLIVRGGSIFSGRWNHSCSTRGQSAFWVIDRNFGFRVARNP
jgi:formylglycine-generating enzyme required for sulfatase activity